eukprot:TRINITY_DN5891_c0_g1_i1.p1 TRINITY_DN5891_c0_g1~~TRINITY_DN5891_c0_g1_i1.p1  ORF type:complete len:780 (-),score=227.21 TRINITY_DN5891_c0_g1_i1:391-2730(-)
MAGEKGEMSRSIKLPQTIDIALRNIKDAKIFAMDIGGSLTKIAYYSILPFKKIVYDSKEHLNDSANEDVDYEVTEGARLHFIKFETKHIEATLDYIQKSLLGAETQMNDMDVKVTGGGAYKYAELIEKKLGLKIAKEDEMMCMIRGCNFLLRNISDEAFIYQKKDDPAYTFQPLNPQEMFPYLLVMIGSGVSVLKVESEDKYSRIGGTATGGGTFWGLGKLLTSAKDFDDLLSLAEQGDHRKVDMLVKDIYGSDYSTLGLPADLIASSFGKAIHLGGDQEKPFSEADIARSLLYIISNDIGQISCLYAMLHKIKRIYFGGFFLRHRPVSLHTISFAINYWSKGEVQANFLRHEGYLGAIGAFLKSAESFKTEKYSWGENLYGSSAFQAEYSSHQRDSKDSSLEIDHLEIDRFDSQLSYCPLIEDPTEYIADTVDLNRDHDARAYWLQCFKESLPKFTERAVASQSHAPDVQGRADKFRDKFSCRLQMLETQPFAFGNLTVRSLLDMREHCLMEFDFHDVYLKQKQLENKAALALLPAHLEKLAMMDWQQKQEMLARGFLAGNVFDWGAKEVALLMEAGKMDFEAAMEHIGPRPWLMDDVDRWVERLKGPPHKCVCIFIDNSGGDFILGVLPFVEEMLRRKSCVILCANSRPILNDVTYAELSLLLSQVAEISAVIRTGLETGQLVARDSGQGSPCLDLARMNFELAEEMKSQGVDLLVLEGMGRAIHTNLYTKFKCECLKVAVLKNKWLAQHLGGDMFSVVFRYEVPDMEQQKPSSGSH